MAAAQQHAGNADQDSSLFSQAFSFISNMNKDDGNIDENRVQQEHQQAYQQGNAGSMSASAMGRCVAVVETTTKSSCQRCRFASHQAVHYG